MARSDKKPRRLVVDDRTYLWSVRHRHHPEGSPYCGEVLHLRLPGNRGHLRLVFQGGPEHLVPDGWVPSGSVGTGGAWLNLHRPGTARALLDAALAAGWQPEGSAVEELDGWTLFGAAAALCAAVPAD
ncbi:hypothetical protein ACWGB8_37710 [Kitasatospora sp. NPDC054939]